MRAAPAGAPRTLSPDSMRNLTPASYCDRPIAPRPWEPRPWREPKPAPPLDVSGRPLELRDVDLDAFLHPKTIAADRRVGAVPQAEHRDDPEVRRLGHRPRRHLLPGAPHVRDGARPPGLQVDLRHPRRHRPRDRPHRPGGRHVRGGARAQGEVRGDLRGRVLGDRQGGREARTAPDRARRGAATSACSGPNTNLNAFESFRDDLEGPSIALVTQSGHQGRPVFQGQELGIRLTHWAPTGNEVDLEFADFARYFADQAEVGVDRVLHRGLQGRPHAHARRRPCGASCRSRS